jgi:UDP-GlcNAc:undecaprenyl-phosphate GlcNAc-1-phosphate transferase
MLLSGVLFDVAFTLARRTWRGQRITAPHRGHLYQIAHRAGIPSTAVAAAHWGFAVFGGLCCLGFIAAPAWWKPEVALLPIVPQVGWLFYVRDRARSAGITEW